MSKKNEKNVYKETLNLPKTDFDMRAGLLKKEPVMQAEWAQSDLYARIRRQMEGRERFILHDGPPYANGAIHIGHTLNKVLKDMTIRVKTMTGYDAPYIPGWDCHGLPIEAKVMEELGEKAKDMDSLEIRRLCEQYALKFVELQSEQFQRLGVMGEFEHPYITMDPLYEAEVLNVFAQLLERKLVYRQLKPVHWSIENQTALADAELEYQDVKDTSIFVGFEIVENTDAVPHQDGNRVMLAVWTTTPWTLPANEAVAVHPDIVYAAVHAELPSGPATLIMAEALRETVLEKLEATNVSELEEFTGQALLHKSLAYAHPLIDGKVCPLVAGTHVTTEDGTGLVHTAPGHGVEDYYTGLQNGLEIYCPVKADGTFDATAPAFLQGLSVWKANPKVIDYLTERKTLLAAETITHSYPHDWRSKTPTIFRATEQWFIGVDRPVDADEENKTLREMAIEACSTKAEDDGVDFIPAWGRNRMLGMLENRPDWCISRQRVWGLPIPAFFNENGEPLCTPASVRAVAEMVAKFGSDAWFKLTPAELLKNYDPADDDNLEDADAFAADTLKRGNDIFDVWFESGSSWAAVAINRDLVSEIPVDLYLEGSDQHRGWFQLSLLPALGCASTPPFKTVLTHGFINDAEGKKMSKSLGNTVDVQEQLTKRGADILRLWVASQDYQDDDRCSDELIAQCEDTYRKIRNTLRFALGSISDYNPETDFAAPAEHSVDNWLKMRLHELIYDVRKAYDRFEFHRACRLMYEFCSIQASSVYMSAVKDRLYCEAPDSPKRRASQAVIREMLLSLVRLLAPILPHTCEEAWQHIPFKPEDWPDSIHLTALPEVDEQVIRMIEDLTPGQADFFASNGGEAIHPGPAWHWEQLMNLRTRALVKIEALRNEGVKNPLDTEVTFVIPDSDEAMREFITPYLGELEDMLGVGYARIEAGPAPDGFRIGIQVNDARELYSRCERSWKRRPDVGGDTDYPELSARDAKVVRQLQA